MPNFPPVTSGPDSVITATGAAASDLRLAVFDPDGDPLSVTLTNLPSYGTLEYFDGASWIAATQNAVITGDEFETLRYTPPAAGGEHGGEALVFDVSDGVNPPVTGTVAFTVVTDSPGPANLYFSATGSNSALNPDLYTLDANLNPHAIPLNTPDGSSAGEHGGFFQYAGNFYFEAFTPSTGDVMFRMDSAGNITPVEDMNGRHLDNNGQVDASYLEFAGRLYLRGDALYQVNPDGSVDSISPITNALPFDDQHGGLIEFDHALYFASLTDTTGQNFLPNVIRLDADGTLTEISTRANPADGSDAGIDGGFIVFNNALYFNAFSETLGTETLFELDAGSATPVEVGVGQLDHTNAGGTASAFHIFNDSLFFNEFSYSFGSDTLFELDSCGCLHEVDYNGEALQNAGALGGMVDFAGSMFFVATTNSTGTALFRLDSFGRITDVYDNHGNGAFDANLVSGFVQFNGSLYFDAYTAGGDALFRVDPNFDPLVHPAQQIDLGGGGTTLAGVNGGFKVLDGNLYFAAYGPHGDELMRIDSDGVVHNDYDINPGPGGNSFNPFTPSGNPDFGVYSLPALYGTGQQDLVAGGPQNEVLQGLGGDDLLDGGGGNDILIGGGGADLFKFDAAGPANVSRVMDYSFDGGDAVDLTALLGGKLTATSNIADFVRLIAVGNNLKIQVDTDGPANGQNWSDVAILDGSNTGALDTVTALLDNQAPPVVLIENDSFNLHTTALTGGGWVVTWTQTGDEDLTKDLNVYARVFDAAGHQITGTFEVSDFNAMDDQNSIVTALPGGGFAVTWQSCTDEILTRVFDASGNDVSGVQPVVTGAPSPIPTQVVALQSGGYVAIWNQPDFGGFGVDPNVYMNVFDSSGGSVSGGPLLVNDPNAPVSDFVIGQSFSTIGFGDHSTMVALQDGFAVMWESLRDDGGGSTHANVFVRVFDFNGTPVTGEIQVNGPDGALQDTPNDIVALGGDNFAVQWESDTLASAQTVYSSIFLTSDFVTYSAAAPVRDDANSDPNILAQPWHLAALKNGGYVSLWGQYDIANSPNADVFIQVYDASGNIGAGSHPGGVQVNTLSGVPNLPDQVVSLAGGGFAVMYDSTRDDGVGSGADQDVFVRLFADDGTAKSGEIRVNAANGLLDAAVETIALPDGSFAVVWTQDAADGAHQDILLQHFAGDGSVAGAPLLIGSTPFDSSDPHQHSMVSELRDALSSANPTLLVAAIDSVTFDFNTVFPHTGFNYTYPLDLHFVDLTTQANPPADLPPVNTVPGTLNIEANTATAIGGISIADPDAGSGSLTTTLSVSHGTLTAQALGGATVSGSGSTLLQISGTLAQINAALGSNNVVYKGDHDYFDADQLTVSTNDNGNTGTGGPLTDTDQVAINLTTHLFGTPGDDSFTALPGNERIDALGGNDTITFGFKLVDARISFSGNQVIVDGPSGSHTVLTGFETYKFTDGAVNENDGNPLVDDLYYYSQYHDVWLAGADADAHFHNYGWHEGRNPNPYFDTQGYLAHYTDVKAAGVDPLEHYDQFGWKEGRDPSVNFDTKHYLAAYLDVAAVHIDPLAHFLAFGLAEGRSSFADGVWG